MADKVYVNAIRCFNRNQNAPQFILGTMIVDVNALFTWLKGEGGQYLSEYVAKDGSKTKQLKLTVMQSDKTGVNVQVDTYGLGAAAPAKMPPNPTTRQGYTSENASQKFPDDTLPF